MDFLLIVLSFAVGFLLATNIERRYFRDLVNEAKRQKRVEDITGKKYT